MKADKSQDTIIFTLILKLQMNITRRMLFTEFIMDELCMSEYTKDFFSEV